MSNQTAEEIANKNKPISFQWEVDLTSALNKEISIPDWIVKSMEEHAEQRLTTVKEKVDGIYTGHTSEEISKAKQEVKEKALTLINEELQ